MSKMKTINHLIIKLNKMLSKRYEDINAIDNELTLFLGFNPRFQNATQDTSINDYRIISNMLIDSNRSQYKDDLYIDIYYLLDNNGYMYITEFNIDSEHPIKDYTLNIYEQGEKESD
jgi:hypothetical protein